MSNRNQKNSKRQKRECAIVRDAKKKSRRLSLKEKPVDLRKDFGRLQIIVKLASIHLTPEKPRYEGGTWHVEGQGNESMFALLSVPPLCLTIILTASRCASAIYYFSSENITPDSLAFRQSVEDGGMDLPYLQDDHRAVETIHGFKNEDPTIQDLGRVFTPEGRLLTFPNTMQHKVQPFELANPSRPGHRKILALFLVDPHLRIISTADVPCQQKKCWEEQVRGIGLLATTPGELTQQILDSVNFPVSLDVAKQQRAELMEERKTFVAEYQKVERQNYFSVRSKVFRGIVSGTILTVIKLCEH